MANKPLQSIKFPGLPDTYTVPQVDNTLTQTGAAADAKKTGDEIADLKSDLTYYTEEAVAVNTTAEGWRLTGTGVCTEASTYEMNKYLVTAGDLLHLTLSKDVIGSEAEGVYQWQSAAGVPSNLPNTNLVGTPVSEAVDVYVTVPTGATYLIVSQFKTNTTNSVKKVTDSKLVKDEVTELKETVDNLDPGLSDEAKEALMACFEHVKWDDDQGQSYYDDLYNALYGVQPDPEVPSTYTRYDWIRLKQYSEVPSGTYSDGGSSSQNVGLYKNGLLATGTYADLNQLNIKATVGVMPPGSLSNDKNSCAFGGGSSSNATSRIGTYFNMAKQWIYVMMHGKEEKLTQSLNDKNVIEIINGGSSPSTVKINGTSHSFTWTNSNVINTPISYFAAYDFNTASNAVYAGVYTKVGDIEIKNQSDELISKLIPVVRKADNVIGIWDSVREAFYIPIDTKYSTIGNSSCVYAVGSWDN